MRATMITALGAACAMTLGACQQDRAPEPAARSVGTQMNAAATSPPTPASAASTQDPSLPPKGTPAQITNTATDASPGTELTKNERQNQLPLAGQTNNYSSNEFAKRGDEKIPRDQGYQKPSAHSDTTSSPSTSSSTAPK